MVRRGRRVYDERGRGTATAAATAVWRGRRGSANTIAAPALRKSALEQNGARSPRPGRPARLRNAAQRSAALLSSTRGRGPDSITWPSRGRLLARCAGLRSKFYLLNK